MGAVWEQQAEKRQKSIFGINMILIFVFLGQINRNAPSSNLGPGISLNAMQGTHRNRDVVMTCHCYLASFDKSANWVGSAGGFFKSLQSQDKPELPDKHKKGRPPQTSPSSTHPRSQGQFNCCVSLRTFLRGRTPDDFHSKSSIYSCSYHVGMTDPS